LTALAPLPGAELVDKGIADLEAREETVEALLVAIAGHRLREAGLDVPEHAHEDAELRLYRMLSADDPDSAYARYNSLLRRLISFAHALEREQGKALRAARGPATDGASG
jgi:hypothetical protein